jgi:hypothetical protein
LNCVTQNEAKETQDFNGLQTPRNTRQTYGLSFVFASELLRASSAQNLRDIPRSEDASHAFCCHDARIGTQQRIGPVAMKQRVLVLREASGSPPSFVSRRGAPPQAKIKRFSRTN